MKLSAYTKRLRYLIYESEGKERKLFLFQVFSWALFIIFLSFFTLGKRNPFSLLVPGINFSFPAVDKRAVMEIYFPVEKSDEFISSPKRILINVGGSKQKKIKQIIQDLFYSMYQGPRRKKPGDPFHPSDDKILKSLPGVQIRNIWYYKNNIYLDLYLNSLLKPEKEMIQDFFHCFELTLKKNIKLRDVLNAKAIHFRVDGNTPSGLIKNNEKLKAVLKLVPEKIILK